MWKKLGEFMLFSPEIFYFTSAASRIQAFKYIPVKGVGQNKKHMIKYLRITIRQSSAAIPTAWWIWTIQPSNVFLDASFDETMASQPFLDSWLFSFAVDYYAAVEFSQAQFSKLFHEQSFWLGEVLLVFVAAISKWRFSTKCASSFLTPQAVKLFYVLF